MEQKEFFRREPRQMNEALKASEAVFQKIDAQGIRVDAAQLDRFIEEAESDVLSAPPDKITSTKRQVSILRNIRKMVDGKGRVHTVHKVKADVGRVYPSGFNYANLARRFKTMVLADEGQEFWEIDAHAAEVVTLATLSGDAKLLQDCLTGDVYREMAIRLYGKRRVGANPTEMRKRAKVMVMVVLYNGMESIPSEWEESYPRSAEWLRQTYEGIMELSEAGEGCTTLTGFGTPRVFEPGFNPRSAVSHIIQSTTAEAFRMALVEADKLASSMGGRVVLSQFDSVLLSLPPVYYAQGIAEAMEKVLKEVGFPMVLRVKPLGKSWE